MNPASLKPGSRLSVSAPKNLFELQVGRPEYLLVAGGIGITPIVGMAQVLARRGEGFIQMTLSSGIVFGSIFVSDAALE